MGRGHFILFLFRFVYFLAFVVCTHFIHSHSQSIDQTSGRSPIRIDQGRPHAPLLLAQVEVWMLGLQLLQSRQLRPQKRLVCGRGGVGRAMRQGGLEGGEGFEELGVGLEVGLLQAMENVVDGQRGGVQHVWGCVV
jgi:hypothetical protein